MVQAVVALGGNVGQIGQTFARALAALTQHNEVSMLEAASLYRSEPMGKDSGNTFFNSACVFDTTLPPIDLLDVLQQIETDFGRTREVHWGPRTLDFDLILYGDEILNVPRLIVPHSHCWYRQFVLEPVEEICPDWMHPVIGRSMQELNERLKRQPFQLIVGGEGIPDELDELLPSELSVDVRRVEQPNDELIEDASLCVWLSHEQPATAVNPLWLVADPDEPDQFMNDVLSAACGSVVRTRIPRSNA